VRDDVDYFVADMKEVKDKTKKIEKIVLANNG
jgi:hypothetical protein